MKNFQMFVFNLQMICQPFSTIKNEKNLYYFFHTMVALMNV